MTRQLLLCYPIWHPTGTTNRQTATTTNITHRRPRPKIHIDPFNGHPRKALWHTNTVGMYIKIYEGGLLNFRKRPAPCHFLESFATADSSLDAPAHQTSNIDDTMMTTTTADRPTAICVLDAPVTTTIQVRS